MTSTTSITKRSSSSAARSRWAAIGAAIAVAIGAGGVGVSQAAQESGERPVFIPMTPCRILDSRAANDIGDFSGPIGPGETWEVPAHGSNGECTIPSDALALSVNLTGLNATERTFFTLYASDVALPLASNLNLDPDSTPEPNLATVELSAGGAFSLFNERGQADAIIDVAGYYVDHNHDDQRSAANGTEADGSVLFNPFDLPVTPPVTSLVTTTVETPSAGTVIVNSTINVASNVPGAVVLCSINDASGLDALAMQQWESPGADGSTAQLSGTRAYKVNGTNSTFEVRLNCQGIATATQPEAGTIRAFDRSITAIFVPDPVTP